VQKTKEQERVMTKHRIYSMSFASVYPHYVAKAEKKGRTKKEVDEIIRWLTGYSQKEFEAQLKKLTDLETFYAKAARPNPSRIDHGSNLWRPGGGHQRTNHAGNSLPR
jgi:hypothetical protein